MILVDSSPSEAWMAAGLSLQGLPVKVENLKDTRSGDIRWISQEKLQVGVELKMFPGDFLASIVLPKGVEREEPRLPDQMIKMAEGFDIAILMLIGFPNLEHTGNIIDFRENPETHKSFPVETTWNWSKHILTYLFSVWFHLGVVPIWTPSKKEAVQSIAALYRWLEKPPEQRGKWIQGAGKRPVLYKPDRAIQILSLFPGIGQDTAKNLLTRFHTLDTIFEASKNDPGLLYLVKGVGAERITGIREALYEEHYPTEEGPDLPQL